MKKSRAYLLFLTLIPTCAFANNPFNIDITVANNGQSQTKSFSFSSISDAENYVNSKELEESFPEYNNNSEVFASLSYLGTPTYVYFEQNSTVLHFVVPGTTINKTFNGSTRSQSVSELGSFLSGNGGSDFNILQKHIAQTTPASPIAGNPGSLQSQMVQTSSSIASYSSEKGYGGNFKEPLI